MHSSTSQRFRARAHINILGERNYFDASITAPIQSEANAARLHITRIAGWYDFVPRNLR